MNEFITRVDDDKYEVIFKTDEHDKYITVQDLCRKLIDHEKPDETQYRQIKTMQPYRWRCGKCNYEQAQTLHFPNFCPNCGRKVTGMII